MKKGLIAIVVVAVLLLLVGGCLVGNYNRLVTGNENVKQLWAQVDNHVQQATANAPDNFVLCFRR